MSSDQIPKPISKRIFNKTTAQNLFAAVIVGGFASVYIEHFITGSKSQERCAALDPEFTSLAESFIGVAKPTGNKDTTIIIERQLTDQDVDLVFPWSRQTTCRLTFMAP